MVSKSLIVYASFVVYKSFKVSASSEFLRFMSPLGLRQMTEKCGFLREKSPLRLADKAKASGDAGDILQLR